MAKIAVPVRVKPDSLEWALHHIERFGDTDFLPLPFEFEAIRKQWALTRPLLETIDITKHSPVSLKRFLVPKPANGFRVVHQLDPVDSLLYNALIYEDAAAIEANRVPIAHKIACSYRVSLSPDGNFFVADVAAAGKIQSD